MLKIKLKKILRIKLKKILKVILKQEFSKFNINYYNIILIHTSLLLNLYYNLCNCLKFLYVSCIIKLIYISL